MSKEDFTLEEIEVLTELVWSVVVKGRTVKIIAGLQDKFPDKEGKYADKERRSV